MKNNPLTLALFWFVALIVYSYVLAGLGIDLPFHWAAPLALLSTFLWHRILVRRLALQRATALARHPREWRDGEDVAFAGVLRLPPGRDGLLAPASGQPAAIYWFQLSKRIGSKSRQSPILLTGAGRLVCELHGRLGTLSLLGYPQLLTVQTHSTQDPARIRALCAQVLTRPTHVWTSTNSLDRATELRSLFTDAELDVVESFIETGSSLAYTLKQAQHKAASAGIEAGIDELQAALSSNSISLSERRLAPDVEVCAFGQYDAAKHQLDIGASLDHRYRDLIPGNAEQVGKKSLRSATVWLVISALIWAGGHVVPWQYAGRVAPASIQAERES